MTKDRQAQDDRNRRAQDDKEYSSCPCGFAKDYLRWYINEKGRTDTRLALDFDRTIMK